MKYPYFEVKTGMNDIYHVIEICGPHKDAWQYICDCEVDYMAERICAALTLLQKFENIICPDYLK